MRLDRIAAARGAVRQAALDLHRAGGYDSLRRTIDYPELNGLFTATS
ncbi:hypothetical protein ACFY4B_17940 [Kitasatospora sp. NPDC001261]